MFFFEKKNTETVVFLPRRIGRRGAKKSKIFCCFCSKKQTPLP